MPSCTSSGQMRGAFLQHCPDHRPSFDEAVNVPTEDAAALYTLCATYELYDVMLSEFHGFIERMPAFRDAVLTQVQSFRSTFVSNLRKYAEKIFAGLDISNACWDQSFNRLEDQDCLALISLKPSDAKVRYDMFCPIIYANPKKLHVGTMFMNPVLMRLLSADKEIAATGKITQIPYSTTFRERKKFLDQMAGDSSSWVSEIFAKWDSVVFEGVPDAVHHADTSPVYDEQEVARQAILNLKTTGHDNSSDAGEDFDWPKDNSLGQEYRLSPCQHQ
ncbi:hypothetical protein C0993_000560 [Termitomyces sp. T159_Od127]|nr:hypothetical protein C0993_000560 [Termitomyces sp. T159_Od127]